MVTPKQCEAIKGLYHLFIRTKGNPTEFEVLVLAHGYYDALLRATGLGTEKIACTSDQVFCLTALLPDGQWRLASHLIYDCSISQCDFRCILLHIGRLESQGQVDFVPVQENQMDQDTYDYDSDNSDSDGEGGRTDEESDEYNYETDDDGDVMGGVNDHDNRDEGGLLKKHLSRPRNGKIFLH
jgi:hypothetical protein